MRTHPIFCSILLFALPCEARAPVPPYYTALELKAVLPEHSQFRGYNRVDEDYRQWNEPVPKKAQNPIRRAVELHISERVDGPEHDVSVAVVDDVSDVEQAASCFHASNAARPNNIYSSFGGYRIGTRCWNRDGRVLFGIDGYVAAAVMCEGRVAVREDGKRIRLDPDDRDRAKADELLKEVFDRATALGLTTQPTYKISTRVRLQVAERLSKLRAEANTP